MKIYLQACFLASPWLPGKTFWHEENTSAFLCKSKTTKYVGAVKLLTKTQLFNFNTYYKVIFRLFPKREMEKIQKFGSLQCKKYGPFKKENSNICKIIKRSKFVKKIFRKEVKHFWFSVIVFEDRFIRQYNKH